MYSKIAAYVMSIVTEVDERETENFASHKKSLNDLMSKDYRKSEAEPVGFSEN